MKKQNKSLKKENLILREILFDEMTQKVKAGQKAKRIIEELKGWHTWGSLSRTPVSIHYCLKQNGSKNKNKNRKGKLNKLVLENPVIRFFNFRGGKKIVWSYSK